MLRDDKGIALIAVVWAIALLATIAASLSLDTRTEARVARNMADAAAAREAAAAGIERAILDLLGTRAGQKIGEGKFRPDGTVYKWKFENNLVYISVQDESSKVNLNQAPEPALIAVFRLADVDQDNAVALADAIADYRDADELRRLRGAEKADYKGAGLAWGPKNAPFEELEELRRVLGMTSALYKRVAPFLTIYSLGNAVNQRFASEQLTQALRQAGLKFFVNSPGTTYAIRADARHPNGAKFVRKAVVQLAPQAIEPVTFLAWQQE